MRAPVIRDWALFGVGNVCAQPVVQRIDLGDLVAILGRTRMAFQCPSQQLHVRCRKQRSGAARFTAAGVVRRIGVAHLGHPPSVRSNVRVQSSWRARKVPARSKRVDLAGDALIMRLRTGSWCCPCHRLSARLPRRSTPCDRRQCPIRPCSGASHRRSVDGSPRAARS